MTWRPPGWNSLAGGGTDESVRYDRVCRCGACEHDGQHEPMCNVHDNDGMPPYMCNCPVGEAARLRRGDPVTEWVHLLEHGYALCPLPGVPGEWPPGHRWVGLQEKDKATCPHCLRVEREEKA